jgi:hypothetical protein
MPSIVQFFHPGEEHDFDSQSKDYVKKKCWNKGDHKRKYLLSKGNYIENGVKNTGTLLFWGEWEPPSIVRELKIPVKNNKEEYPKYLHVPYLPSLGNIKKFHGGNYQNTDPFVFGRYFKYSNCLQNTSDSLKELKEGSLILFGSNVNRRFAIDTIFVVKDSVRYTFPDDPNVDNIVEESNLYRDIVLRMSCINYNAHNFFTLYTGATFDDDIYGMYSYVPSLKSDTIKRGFPRIIMPDEFYSTRFNSYFSKNHVEISDNNRTIIEKQNQGVKITQNVNIDDIKEFWEYIKNIVSEEYVLGYNFDIPMEYDIFNI